MDRDDNPYTILGVSPDASEAEIKAAYRKNALRYHPDKQKTPETRAQATETFAKLSNAYEILSDPQQKQKWDRKMQQPFHEPFHDPFQVFEEVLRQEFGRSRRTADRGGDVFSGDPLFTRTGLGLHDPFFRGSRRSSPASFFDHDPFFGGDMFGGRDPFEEMHRMHEQMHRQMHRQQQQPPSRRDSRNSDEEGYVTSQSTTIRWVNGKQQKVTERTVRRHDGTIVEQHTETTGDDDFPGQWNARNSTASQRALKGDEIHDLQRRLSRRENDLQRRSSKASSESKDKSGRRGWFW